jgi:hypothetical protein
MNRPACVLEKMQAHATDLIGEGGRACGSTFAATSFRRFRPASEGFGLSGFLPREGRDTRAVLSTTPLYKFT